MLKKEDGLCYIKIVIKKSRHRGREIWFLSYIGKKKKTTTQNLRQEDIGIIEAGAQILKLDNITYNIVIILIT